MSGLKGCAAMGEGCVWICVPIQPLNYSTTQRFY